VDTEWYVVITMAFSDEITQWPPEKVRQMIASATPDAVERALEREDRTPADLAALLSPAAVPRLEDMARMANRLTRQYFGRTISLYAPIYISNLCAADCVYCGFAAKSGIRMRRVTLKDAEIRAECAALAERGFRHVLLLTGEAPAKVPPRRIADAARVAAEYFPSVSVEVYAMETPEYALLEEAGVEGVTLYQETYDPQTYRQVHLSGKKMDYAWRLDALERAGRAGIRRLTIGALLGLYDWACEGFWMGLHGRYLQRTCWRSALFVSFPRLRHTPNRFRPPALVTDAQLVQLILAMRLFLPQAGFNLSTREPAWLRDRLVTLGITSMSAGSSTRPGGYASRGEEVLEQFEIEDTRGPDEVVAMIRRAGLDPVWKDYDHAFYRETGTV